MYITDAAGGAVSACASVSGLLLQQTGRRTAVATPPILSSQPRTRRRGRDPKLSSSKNRFKFTIFLTLLLG